MRPLHEILTDCIEAGVGLPPTGKDDPDPKWVRKDLHQEIDVNPSTLRGWEDGVWPKDHNFIALRKMLTPQPDAPLRHRELYDELVTCFLAGQPDVFPEVRDDHASWPGDPPSESGGLAIKPDASDERSWSGRAAPHDSWPGPITLAVAVIQFAVIGIAALANALGPWLVVGSTLSLLFAWFFEASLRGAVNRETVAAFFEHEGYAKAYKSGLSMILDQTDRWLLNRRFRVAGRRNPYLTTSIAWAWPVRLYAFAILVASLYPMTMMFWQWVDTDQHVKFGNNFLLLSTTNFFFKLLTIAAYLGSFFAAIYASLSSSKRRWPWMLLAITLALVGLGLLALIPSPINGTKYYANGHLGTMSTGVLIAFALICYFRVVEVVLGPAAAAGFGGFIVAFGSDRIDQIATHLANNWGGNKDLWFDGISSFTNACGSILIAVPLVLLLKRVIDRPGFIAPLSFAILTMATIAMLSYGAGLLKDWRPYYLYIGLIPIVNAVFDYFSLGLTRWALRSGLRKVGLHTLAYSALDLFAAMIIFLGLGSFCIIVFNVVNEIASGVEGSVGQVIPLNLPDAESIFQGISDAPVQHTWLYLTFLTTLLPTLAHASVAVWAIGPTIMGSQARAKIASHYRAHAFALSRDVAYVVVLVIWSTFALLLPVALISWVANSLSAESCELGYLLLNFFITVLHLLIDNPDFVPLFDIVAECRAQSIVEVWTN